jgi:hypothetical protein
MTVKNWVDFSSLSHFLVVSLFFVLRLAINDEKPIAPPIRAGQMASALPTCER